MATWTIYPDASNYDGFIDETSFTSMADAFSYPTPNVNTSSTDAFAGLTSYTTVTYWTVGQVFFSFDTSDIASATVAQLSLWVNSIANNTSGWSTVLLSYNFTPPVASGYERTPTELAALTQVASILESSLTSPGRNTWSYTDPDDLNYEGQTGLVLVDSRNITGTDPDPVNNTTDGVSVRMSDTFGTFYDPYLYVEGTAAGVEDNAIAFGANF